MKKLLILSALSLSVSFIYGQALPADNLLSTLNLQAPKFDTWLARRKFFFANSTKLNDTLVKVYNFKSEIKKRKLVDSIKRSLIRKDGKEGYTITYQTVSQQEFDNLKDQLGKAGFYCNQANQSDTVSVLLQHKDVTVTTFTETKDSVVTYSLQFYKKKFPKPEDIYFADDLLCFTSHEYLTYYFGEQNVKKDIYYFSSDELVQCSVLFLNSNRQVVFIWDDEVNKSTIANLLFGGQQKLKSIINSDKFIAENSWRFKSGIHAGMPLYELRVLNGQDFKFYGGKSVKSGMVIKDNPGKLNFKKEALILGCMNCTDEKFAAATTLNADDALTDGRILFVLSVVLNPEPAAGAASKPVNHKMFNN